MTSCELGLSWKEGGDMCSHARVSWAKFCETSNCRRGKVSVAVVAVPASTPKNVQPSRDHTTVAQQR